MDAKEFVRIVDGSDTAVLLIHGIAGNPSHFKRFVPLIPENWSICNLLLDGHGSGVREFGASSMKKWKEQVFGQLEELLETHRRVLIVAHSMGTLFAIRAAVAQPDRIAGLFLLNIPMRIHLPPRTVRAALKNALGLSVEGDATARAMREGSGVELSPYPWQYLSWFARFVELLREITAVRALLPELNVPALAFHAQGDELVSKRALNDLRVCPGLLLRMLPKSGHFHYEEQDLRLLQTELERQIAEIKRER